MANSFLAGVRGVLDAAVLDPEPIGGISPPPLPSTALFPYITLQQIGNTEVESMEGRSGLNRTIMQVNCWHGDYEKAFSLRRGILMLARPWTVPISLGLTIAAVHHLTDMEMYDGPRELHQLIARYAVWWTE